MARTKPDPELVSGVRRLADEMAKAKAKADEEGTPMGRTKMKVSITYELAHVIQTRAAELGVTQSFVVETALRDRLGMRSLMDIKKVLATV